MPIPPIVSPAAGPPVAQRAGVTAPQASAASTPVADAAPPPAQVSAVDGAMLAAALTQGGLAQLMADLTQAVAAPDMPQPVQAAAAQVLALRTQTEPPPSALDLKLALAQSGLFLEADSAAGLPATDLKAALRVFSQALKTWLASTPPSGDAAPATPPAPPPPYRGAPTSAQPPALPALPQDAKPEALARGLLQQTGAALARQELLQIASLPEPEEGSAWMYEMPFVTPQGTAVAQFQISRDRRGRAGGGEDQDPQGMWRVGFSLDIEPIGPVHAQAILSGSRAGVTLWAEREASAQSLRRQEGSLAKALVAAGLDSDVAVYTGAPRRPPPKPGRFLDRAS